MPTTRVREPSQNGVDALLADTRSRRRLPRADERRRVREAAGVSQRQLARALGVSWTAIQRWETGSRPRRPEHVIEYRRALDGLRLLADGGETD
jgi:DNA-binding XRE family transcriptional regulator